jgi:hypothetical protein
MRYLVLLKATQPATAPTPELMAAIAQLGEEATRSGALLDTAGLAPSADGVKVVVGSGKLSATDGPFAEAKEMISYALYDVASKEEATAWTNRFMQVHVDAWPGWEGEAEILRVFGPQDFAAPA